MVVGLFLDRNQIALFHHGKSCGVRTFGEIFHRREHHDAIALNHIHKPVGRVANTGRDIKFDVGAEVFHGVRHVVHIAVIGEIDVVLAGADPNGGGIAAHGDRTRVRHDGKHFNLESVRHPDVGERFLQIGDIGRVLRNALGRRRVGFLEGT